MKYTFLLVILTLMLACKNSNEQLKDEFKSKIEQRLKDIAFKQNENIIIYDLDLLKIDTVNQNTIDSFLANRAIARCDDYQRIQEMHLDLLKKDVDVYKLYKEVDETLSKTYLQNISDDTIAIHAYKDTARMFRDIAKQHLDKTLTNKTPEIGYRVKAFLKSTTKSSTDSSNFLDTAYYLFDANRQLIDTRITIQ